MQKLSKYSLLIVLITFISTLAQTKVKVGNVYPGEVEMGGFNLSEDCIISITGEGASFDKWENFYCYYAWILNTNSREVVWRSQNSDDFIKSDGEYDFDSEIELEAGNYEVYFAAGRESDQIIIDGFSMLEGLFNNRRSNIREFKRDYFIEISSEDNLLTYLNPFKLVNSRNDAIVSLIRVGDSEKLEKGFSLTDDTEVKIYGLGEGIKNEFYDFGYIFDVVKNKRIWTFNQSDVEFAGGGKKNFVAKSIINLPKGSYMVRYQSDDSHSFDEWNVLPPNDPQYWGIVVSLNNENDKKKVIPFRTSDIAEPILDLTKIEADELVSQGFAVAKNMNLRIICVGEGYKELADYGWIENADTKEIVWRMTYEATDNAGGSRKNRIFDNEIYFESGNYIAYFITDDSHNYGDWNDTPPFETDQWGISLWSINKSDERNVKLFNANNYKSKNLIAEITKVRDSERLSKSFKLSNNSKIRIISIGESSGNELADYSWITDENNRTVWKMSYDATTNAGGARKNRLFNSIINLDAGSYRLHYTTDDSHSFGDWNSTPPNNPQMYGVTILFEK